MATNSRLRKILKYTFVPGTPDTPGFPGSAARPGYSYTITENVCVYYPGNYAEAEARLLALLAAQGSGYGGGGISYSGGGYACTLVQRVVSVPYQPGQAPIPSIPGTQSQTLEDFQLGWTGRAHSVAVMTGPGRFGFTVPASSVGAVVGLTRSPQSSGYGDIEFGFSVSRGTTKIIESGSDVMTLGPRPNQPLEIRRTKGNIEYWVDGALVYTRPNSSTPYVLGASLYSGGDEVTDPSYESWGEGGGAGVALPFRGYASGTGVFARGVGRMEPFAGVSSARARGEAANVMRAFAGLGGDAYAIGRGVMAPFAGEAESLGVPTYALMSGSLLPFAGAATGLTGGMGQGAGVAQPFTGFAGQGVRGSGRGAMLPFRSTVFNLTPADEAFAVSFADLSASVIGNTELFAVVNSSMEITGIVTVSTEYLADVVSAMALDSQTTLDLEIEALVQSLMRVAASASDPTLYGASVYNMDVGGSTRYTNYGFNSFAMFDGVHYGAKADGIYKLQGRNDNGAPVSASVDMGKTNFGSSSRKKLPYCYVGIASSGKLVLKVTADTETFVYTMTADNEDLKEQRFVLGKGLRATYYKLVLEGEGDVFDLDSIEFFPVELSRRL